VTLQYLWQCCKNTTEIWHPQPKSKTSVHNTMV